VHYDVVIIGAGMSGLAAGIRLAYFDRRVCIVERHYAYGGLNSYYTLGGREYDVGLHAVTNFARPAARTATAAPDVRAPTAKALAAVNDAALPDLRLGDRNAPMNKLLRQLRLSPEDFDLKEQTDSEVRFPGRRLRFSNDVALLIEDVATVFPTQADRFRRLIEIVRAYDDTDLHAPYRSTRTELSDRITDPALLDMLLCPIMYYGSAEEHDLDFTQFVTLFKALFLEGLARPPGGVRTILRALVRKYRACGGKLRMRCGVQRIDVDGERAMGVTLETGETLTADYVLSSAGRVETMRLCGEVEAEPTDAGRSLSFVESIAVLDEKPASLGFSPTIVFFNDAERFTYAVPDEPVDLRSGVACSPNNYQEHEHLSEGVFRITWLASFDRWAAMDDAAYAAAKGAYHQRFLEQAAAFMPALAGHVVAGDMFTPRTILHYTGHLGGAVYGSPRKVRDGRTRLRNLFLCGTDQGYLGIVGAMLSGITMANLHVLAKS